MVIQKVYENIESCFEGIVVAGNKIGRKIGFPTANLNIQSGINFPTLNGVYSVEIQHGDERYGGVMNIGVKPTFEEDLKEKVFEVHIFEFDKEIYGELLKVEIRSFIRREKKFRNVEDLKKQLAEDCDTAKEQLLNKNQETHYQAHYLQEFNRDIETTVIHLPDLDFVRFCEEKFSVNRGVYNTLDKWFAEHQVVNIIRRRMTILRFLYWVTVYIPQECKLEFGPKGLTEQLSFYYMNHVKGEK
ncbi:riboflavin kinase [Solibacillus isronensis]|uniref:riboflavin kinase n=1 Tax=Solibacillus isronensis TaxID=412383 RepID=UPI00399F6617